MARQQIKGNIGTLFVISLVIIVISGLAGLILSFIPFGTLAVSIIITPAFSLSLLRVYLNLANYQKPTVGDAFDGFNDFWSAFKVSFLVGLFIFLWSLLFYIPGIIKAISYSQAMRIVAENPGMSAREAINRSKSMMHGHKMDYFVLGLSFIGWTLLGGITFGLVYIWVTPYICATEVNFYNDIKPAIADEPATQTAAAE